MHTSSYDMMRRFRDVAKVQPGATVLDVGGADVNGSYRPIFEDCTYQSLDFADSDIVVTGYDWPIDDASFDVVISGQAFEHDPRFWMTLQNMNRVLKRGGVVALIVPSAGAVHRHPVDCYRFLPDSMKAFAQFCGWKLLKIEWNKESSWRDLGGVFRKP